MLKLEIEGLLCRIYKNGDMIYSNVYSKEVIQQFVSMSINGKK